MRLSLSLAIMALVSISSANPEQKRAAAPNESAFSSAANALISTYFPTAVLAAITPAVASAASAASVTGNPESLLFSALDASPRPSWLVNAIPSGYSSQVAALESAIDALRPRPVLVITTTGTNSAGQTVTSTISSTIPSAKVTTGTNSQGSTFTSTLTSLVPVAQVSAETITTSGTNSQGSSFTSTLTTLVPITPHSSTVVSTVIVETTTDSHGSTITTSITTSATIAVSTSSSSSGLAAAPTALGRGAAGVIALVGLAVAL
jgi:hypothetical protein